MPHRRRRRWGSMNTFRHVLVMPAHTTSYLEAGPEDGPLLVFVHGWPGLASTWRYQLGYFAARGYRVVAPDMRGEVSAVASSRHCANGGGVLATAPSSPGSTTTCCAISGWTARWNVRH